MNVEGTRNVLRLAKEAGVFRSVYVSSVDSFAANRILANEDSPYVSSKRAGGYAISKAMANHLVLDFRKEGMDIRIVYPSGFFGPHDLGHNHLNQLLIDFLNGRTPGVVKQWYDLADGLDIASGTLSVLFEADKDSSYILDGHYVSLEEFVRTASKVSRIPQKVRIFPIPLARLGVPFLKVYCPIHHRRFLYTGFSLNLLKNANRFDRSRAEKDLHYQPCPFLETMEGTVAYLREQNKIPQAK